MARREIKNLDLKIKYTKEYLDNGGYKKIYFKNILEGLLAVKLDGNGKVDPDTVNATVNAFMMVILQSHFEPPFYSSEHISEYISTLQKALFFDQENIDTPEQFDKIYDEFKQKDNMLFRGQREAKWRLYSKLQRRWIIENLSKNGRKYQNFIETIVANGSVKYGGLIREILQEDHIDVDNDIAILGFLQHHGCPTPLLDWTFEFPNAVFFALDGLQPKQNKTEIEDYCSVYFIKEEHFEGSSMRAIMTDSLNTISDKLKNGLIEIIANGNDALRMEMTEKFKNRSYFDKSRYKGSGMIRHMTEIKRMITFPITYFSDRDKDSGISFSINNSHNIQNQSGVFTWNADSTKPLEMVGNEQYGKGENEGDNENYRFCQCFNINKSLEQYILRRLKADGITREFIYPNVDIDASDIYEQSK